MIKPHTVDGITYTKENVLQERAWLIELRDLALKQADFEAAVALSHIVAMLHHYAANLEDNKP